MYKIPLRSIGTRPDAVRAACLTKDFFGISEISSKEIAGASTNATQRPDVADKYDPLVKPRDRLMNDEKDVTITFGRMRLDSENVPRKHGQFEPNATEQMYSTIDIKQLFEKQDTDEEIKFQNVNEDWSAQTIGNQPYKISEVRQAIDLHDILNIFKKHRPIRVTINKPPLVFDFGNLPDDSTTDVPAKTAPSCLTVERSLKTTSNLPSKEQSREAKLAHQVELANPNEPKSPRNLDRPGELTSDNRARKTQPKVNKVSATSPPESEPPRQSNERSYKPKLLQQKEAEFRTDRMPIEELDPMSAEYQQRVEENDTDFEFEKILDKKYDVSQHETEPINAAQYLKQIRSKEIEPSAKGLKHRMQNAKKTPTFDPRIKLDSQGFRNYTNQVPDWRLFRRVDILNYLKSQIIYNNYDILAINKPYGIASHDESKTREPIDINGLMQEVASSMNLGKVHLVHRLDKTTTGVLLFATSPERAAKLNKQFKAGEIEKTYWCLTKGLPDPEDGVIDIPIGDHYVGGKLRSCPVPEAVDEKLQLVKRWREARRAITEYRTLRATTRAALVEVKPKTGVKHQIRCHLGFGLRTPILGDHKYSSLGRMAPQKLPMQILNSLHLRQEKVRTLPIYLHAKTIVIPGAKANGETLFISAPVPQHFMDIVRTLKLDDEEIRKSSTN